MGSSINFKYLQMDNGSEFSRYFHQACKNLNLEHYFSRVRTPEDNPEIERYNRTLEEEFLQMGNYIEDVDNFNRFLTDWLIEYNFNRPHHTLGYSIPMDFLSQMKGYKVLPIYSTCTNY
ncbi:MAG TPA: integrase core domain-containing protein [bacterium]|nr:integrase core domain-containing protein [bacterium]HOM26394.1 integrase core domain-containing protein [bacterium]